MTADPEFRRRDRAACRQELGLPADLPLIGYIGSWTRSRRTLLILDAFERIRARRPDARLVLSGRPPQSVLDTPGVINLGYLPDRQVPLLVAALDVASVVTADTPFGRYSYPAKLCEAIACRTPVVAAGGGPLRWMLGDSDAHLVPQGDVGRFSDRVLALLDAPVADYPEQPGWPEIARRLASMLAFNGHGERL